MILSLHVDISLLIDSRGVLQVSDGDVVGLRVVPQIRGEGFLLRSSRSEWASKTAGRLRDVGVSTTSIVDVIDNPVVGSRSRLTRSIDGVEGTNLVNLCGFDLRVKSTAVLHDVRVAPRTIAVVEFALDHFMQRKSDN